MTMRLKIWGRGMGWWVLRMGVVLVLGSVLAIGMARQRILGMGDRVYVVERGVPAERIVLDYAGFTTLDSVVRAREVFGQETLLIISQRDHVMRAVYLAEAHGMEAVGVAAAEVGFRTGWKTDLREELARVRAVWDVKVWNRRPHFLGPRIEIALEPGVGR